MLRIKEDSKSTRSEIQSIQAPQTATRKAVAGILKIQDAAGAHQKLRLSTKGHLENLKSHEFQQQLKADIEATLSNSKTPTEKCFWQNFDPNINISSKQKVGKKILTGKYQAIYRCLNYLCGNATRKMELEKDYPGIMRCQRAEDILRLILPKNIVTLLDRFQESRKNTQDYIEQLKSERFRKELVSDLKLAQSQSSPPMESSFWRQFTSDNNPSALREKNGGHMANGKYNALYQCLNKLCGNATRKKELKKNYPGIMRCQRAEDILRLILPKKIVTLLDRFQESRKNTQDYIEQLKSERFRKELVSDLKLALSQSFLPTESNFWKHFDPLNNPAPLRKNDGKKKKNGKYCAFYQNLNYLCGNATRKKELKKNYPGIMRCQRAEDILRLILPKNIVTLLDRFQESPKKLEDYLAQLKSVEFQENLTADLELALSPSPPPTEGNFWRRFHPVYNTTALIEKNGEKINGKYIALNSCLRQLCRAEPRKMELEKDYPGIMRCQRAEDILRLILPKKIVTLLDRFQESPKKSEDYLAQLKSVEFQENLTADLELVLSQPICPTVNNFWKFFDAKNNPSARRKGIAGSYNNFYSTLGKICSDEQRKKALEVHYPCIMKCQRMEDIVRLMLPTKTIALLDQLGNSRSTEIEKVLNDDEILHDIRELGLEISEADITDIMLEKYPHLFTNYEETYESLSYILGKTKKLPPKKLPELSKAWLQPENGKAMEALVAIYIENYFKAFLVRETESREELNAQIKQCGAGNEKYLVIRKVFEKVLRYFDKIKKIKPKGFKEELKEGEPFPNLYQKEALHALKTKKRVLIAHEMGLGKTAMALMGKEHVRSKKTLVVCPASLKEHWLKKIGEYYQSDKPGYPKVAVINSKTREQDLADARNADIVIVNFEMLVSNGNGVKTTELIQKMKCDYLIVDESHNTKKPSGAWSRAVRQLSFMPSIKHLALLSGTPLPNNLADIGVQTAILCPHEVEAAKERIQKLLDAKPEKPLIALVESGIPESLAKRAISQRDNPGLFYQVCIDIFVHQFIKRFGNNPYLIRKYLKKTMVRRDIEEILKLPELRVSADYHDMESEQEDVYGHAMDINLPPLHKMDLLRKVALDPRIIDVERIIGKLIAMNEKAKNDPQGNGPIYEPEELECIEMQLRSLDLDNDTKKYEILNEKITGLIAENKKVVVFSSRFAKGITRGNYSLLKRLKKWFPDQVLRVDGDVNNDKKNGGVSERDRVISGFRDEPKKQIMLVTTETVGEGLDTLKVASEGIFLDLPYNEATLRQAYKRLHRQGQANDVNISILLARNTIDEAMWQYIKDKERVLQAAMQGKPLTDEQKKLLNEKRIRKDSILMWYLNPHQALLSLYNQMHGKGQENNLRHLNHNDRQIAGLYARYFSWNWEKSYSAHNARLVKGVLLKLHGQGRAQLDRVADLACGPLVMQRVLEDHVSEKMINVDFNPFMLEAGLTMCQKPAAVTASGLTHLPFANQTLNIITCSLAFQDLRPKERVQSLLEMNRVLRPDGTVILTLSRGVLQPDEFEKLIEQLPLFGFQIEKEFTGHATSRDHAESPFEVFTVTCKKVSEPQAEKIDWHNLIFTKNSSESKGKKGGMREKQIITQSDVEHHEFEIGETIIDSREIELIEAIEPAQAKTSKREMISNKKLRIIIDELITRYGSCPQIPQDAMEGHDLIVESKKIDKRKTEHRIVRKSKKATKGHAGAVLYSEIIG